MADTLEKYGVETEIFHIGTDPIYGCTGCRSCFNLGKCVYFDRDVLGSLAPKCYEADGIVIGSPVYFAGINGALSALLDRLFYSAGGKLCYKPAAAVVSCRRGGNASAFDRINKYFTITQMPVVASQYWNEVHGFTAEDVRKDKEGLQTMRRLGTNMAWLLKSIAAGGGPIPLDEPRVTTSFHDGL